MKMAQSKKNKEIARLTRAVLDHVRIGGAIEADQWTSRFYVRARRMRRGIKDEARRAYQSPGKWEPIFPLMTMKMTRQNCVDVVRAIGWRDPPRSSCWMCPNRDNASWVRMAAESPSDFAKAVKFEETMREADDAMWLTNTGFPLSNILTTAGVPESPFTGRCDSGFCFT